MASQFCFYYFQTKKNPHGIASWTSIYTYNTRSCINPSTKSGYGGCVCKWKQEKHDKKLFVSQRKPFIRKNMTVRDPVKVVEKKGTVVGAVALIIGTCIGSGILALPKKAAPSGIVPSSIAMVLCWAFLLIESLLLMEINVSLRNNKKKKPEVENELEVISIRTMAQETLGDWGGILATVTYVFLGYTSMIAYSSKSGEILFRLINVPESVSGSVFTLVFALLVSIGGTATTAQVNQCLTASTICLLVSIEVLAIVYGGFSGFVGGGDWGKVPATIPIMIFTLVYHDLAPVLCAYLDSDLRRLRASVLIGSFVPLIALLVWDAIALSLSAQVDHAVDPVELLMSVRWSGVSFMVEAFSLLTVGTSLISTLLSFIEFFKEQLKVLSSNSPTERRSLLWEPEKPNGKRWGRKELTFIAMAIAVGPTLLVSCTVPDAFSTATDIAGGYCMTMLYGILPPAMTWALNNKEREIVTKKCSQQD